MWKSDQIAAGCQGAAFFISICIIGLVWGHETVIRHFLVKEPDYDKSKPPWNQPECYKRAKEKSRIFFPLYWYWGNIRSALVFWLFAVLTTAELGQVSPAELSAGAILLGNLVLYLVGKRDSWEK